MIWGNISKNRSHLRDWNIERISISRSNRSILLLPIINACVPTFWNSMESVLATDVSLISLRKGRNFARWGLSANGLSKVKKCFGRNIVKSWNKSMNRGIKANFVFHFGTWVVAQDCTKWIYVSLFEMASVFHFGTRNLPASLLEIRNSNLLLI